MTSSYNPARTVRAIFASGLLTMVAAAAVALSGCVGTEKDEEPTVSEKQDDALRDGQITREEYDAAFAELVRCVEEGGGFIVGGERVDAYRPYEYQASISELHEACYLKHYGLVDEAWQAAHVDINATTMTMRECLVARGIEPPATRDEIDAEFAELGLTIEECFEEIHG